jgi:hypothetical protein
MTQKLPSCGADKIPASRPNAEWTKPMANIDRKMREYFIFRFWVIFWDLGFREIWIYGRERKSKA